MSIIFPKKAKSLFVFLVSILAYKNLFALFKKFPFSI